MTPNGFNSWFHFISQVQEFAVAMDFCRIQTVYGKTIFLLSFN
ncbi:hypothetical protein LEP1GSC115_2260 [Leptospira interrogans serovar Australis str. 200703203]|uniref:Uncharacterized protein n=1 Tax=Leptospira interrogans serovar Australis str. 200703203 TaxID=1085541 RepID=N1V0Q6_LEPIR|nr:hypothetical protein LEP1GSC115_2260 [Leptospira interrogans serovar Australis str. 200703203]